MKNPAREFFDAGELSLDQKKDLQFKILSAIQHMDSKLGVGEDRTRQSFEKEISRGTASTALDYLASNGVPVKGTRVLDLGAGLGKLSVEAARRGAQPVAVEPGAGMGRIIAERLESERHGLRGDVITSAGEHLPFQDECFDLAVSLQVLEHVTNPYDMLQETFRVLKPGSFFYLTCENYLSFWEPHYGVRWFPLLPKSIGSLYLRLRGRSPEFLHTSITYTTRPGVRRMLKRCGFISMREQKIKALIESPSLLKSRWMRSLVIGMRWLMPIELLTRVVSTFELITGMFNPGVYVLVQKPRAA